MTDYAMDRCLRRLAGKARACGIFWDESVAELYMDVLAPLDDDDGWQAVETAALDREGFAEPAKFRRMVTVRQPDRKHQIRDHSQPGHELQRQGVPAYELMRQGAMKHIRETHNFTGTWDEWVALHRDDMKPWDNVMKRLDARARGEAEKTDDPFRWRPGEPLPPESDADRARKRQAIERLREEVAR